MKKTTAALLAVICALLSGCSLGSGGSNKKPINVSYSDMFTQKSASAQNETVTKQANAQKQAAAAPESSAEAADTTDAPPAQSGATSAPTPAPASSASGQSKAASSPEKQEKAAAAPAPRAGETESNTSDPNNSNSKTESETKPVLVTPTKLPDKAAGSAVNKDIANTPLGGVCYLPYKQEQPEETSEPNQNQTTSGESNSESDSGSKPKKEKTKYDYGYRVVFRTSSETYLMGSTPYKTCAWDDIGKVCREIEEKLETDCEMVGAPSLEDLKMFTEAGIYFPEKHEFWTSTLTAEKGFKAYYRNSKGTFYSTKSTSQTCGACVIIKVKTSQSNNELLSSSWENFSKLQAQLEKEAADYKAAASNSANTKQ